MKPTLNAKELPLSQLYQMPYLSNVVIAYFVEACAVCFTRRHHQDNLELLVHYRRIKSKSYTFVVTAWKPVDAIIEASWLDQEEATEAGACAIAFLLIQELTDYTVISRSRKNTGFDYWLGYSNDPLMQKKARLEISGIFEGSESELKTRVKQKIEQTKISDITGFPAYVVVVEFSKPLAIVVRNEPK